MVIRTFAGLALAALLITGCDDLSQKKPQTGSPTAGAVPTLTAPEPRASGGSLGAPVEARTHPAPAASGGERSIRLFGRGVSRQRQTRV